MTAVTYNGVTMQNVLTQEVSQEPVYDTAGNVDQIYVRTIVTVKFLFHANDGTGLGVGVGSNLALGTKAKLDLLTTNRRRFTMTVGGNTLFDVSPSAVGASELNIPTSGPQDINHGPRPKLNLQEIIGTKVVRGTFTVELAVPSCGTPGGIVSLRWWTTDDVGVNWYTTRTISGLVRVANKNIGPHSIRGLIFPELQAGFRRESMTFTESLNGLELEFTIKDKEIYRSAPFPASTARGRYRMSSQVPGATVVESECSVELTGAHNVPQSALIQLGIKIIDNKLQLKEQGVLEGSHNPKAMLLFYAIEEDLFENRVNVVARIMHTGQGEDGFEFFPQANKTFGKSLPSDIAVGGVSYDPNKSLLLPGPTAPITTIIENALQTPCAPDSMPSAEFAIEQQTPSDEEGPQKNYLQKDEPPPKTNAIQHYSSNHQDAPYLYYKTTTHVWRNHGIAFLALNTSSDSSSDKSITPVNLNKTISGRVIRVRAMRMRLPPEMFAAKKKFTDDKGRVHHLDKDTVVDQGRAFIQNGVPIFYSIQEMLYVVDAELNLEKDGVKITTAPWMKDEGQKTELPPDIFTKSPHPDA